MCEVDILQAQVNKIEVLSSIQVSAKSTDKSSKGHLGFLLTFIKTDNLSMNITRVSTLIYLTIAFWEKIEQIYREIMEI